MDSKNEAIELIEHNLKALSNLNKEEYPYLVKILDRNHLEQLKALHKICKLKSPFSQPYREPKPPRYTFDEWEEQIEWYYANFIYFQSSTYLSGQFSSSQTVVNRNFNVYATLGLLYKYLPEEKEKEKQKKIEERNLIKFRQDLKNNYTALDKSPYEDKLQPPFKYYMVLNFDELYRKEYNAAAFGVPRYIEYQEARKIADGLKAKHEANYIKDINFFSFPEYTSNILQRAEIIAKRLVENKFSYRGFSKIFLLANNIFGKSTIQSIFDNDIDITKYSNYVRNSLLNTIQEEIKENGYTTKQSVVNHTHINYSKTSDYGFCNSSESIKERELDRSLQMFCESFDLEYVRPTKALKEKYGLTRLKWIIHPIENLNLDEFADIFDEFNLDDTIEYNLDKGIPEDAPF